MIPLFLQNGVAYVWSSKDWYTLRTQHRICGSLLGSTPPFPRQNEFLGLPLALMSEEVALLVENNICELFELPCLTENISQEEIEEIKQCEQQTLKEQTEALRKKKIEQLSQKIDIIVAGKRKKMLAKGITDTDLDKQSLLQEEIDKLQNVAPAHLLVHLPTEHHIPTERHKVGIDALEPSVTKDSGVSRYAIFKDLWNKGHYITSGTKFGCDYLLYPGDPVRFHAMYMVRCISSQDKSFQPSQIVAFGRLSVAVNKLAILAICNSYMQIEYQTIQWHDNMNS